MSANCPCQKSEHSCIFENSFYIWAKSSGNLLVVNPQSSLLKLVDIKRNQMTWPGSSNVLSQKLVLDSFR